MDWSAWALVGLPPVAALASRGLHLAQAPAPVQIGVRWACIAGLLALCAWDVRRVRATSADVARRLGRTFLFAPAYLWRRNRVLGRSQATAWAIGPSLVMAYLIYPFGMSRLPYEEVARQVAERDPLPRCDSNLVRTWLPREVEAAYGLRVSLASAPLQIGRDALTRRCVVELATERGDAIDAFDVALGAGGEVTVSSDVRIASP